MLFKCLKTMNGRKYGSEARIANSSSSDAALKRTNKPKRNPFADKIQGALAAAGWSAAELKKASAVIAAINTNTFAPIKPPTSNDDDAKYERTLAGCLYAMGHSPSCFDAGGIVERSTRSLKSESRLMSRTLTTGFPNWFAA